MDPSLTHERSRTITFSLLTTGASLIPTVYVAVISNSLTLFTDLLRCAVEFLAILVAFLISRQTRPENLKRYNYGFSKLEHLSSLTVGAAMAVAFIVATFSALQRIVAPEVVVNAGLGLILAVLSVLGNLYIWAKNAALARRAPSPITQAQARLFLSKTVACLVVAISLSMTIFFKESAIGMHADALGSLAVAGFLLYSSYHMIFHSLGEILDASLEENAQLLIMKTLVKFESQYKNFSRIRTRYGGEKNYIELWLDFDPTLRLEEIHKTTSAICKEIENIIPAAEVVIVPMPG